MDAPRSRARRRAGWLLLAVVLAGCGGGPVAAPSTPSAAPSLSPTPSPSPSPSPSPVAAKRAPRPAPVDPLTGRPGVPSGSVVVVKIDNSPLARPFHRGLDQASVIYQELMEGGATRFLAVFAPATGREVGPVRSVREGDLELLGQYGRVALGSSGGNTGVLATVATAAREGRLLDAGYDVLPGPYRKAERRRDAFNFFTSPRALVQARPGGQGVKDVGLRFGALPPAAGSPAARAGISFSPSSRVRTVYDRASGRWAVFQDGVRMRDFAPSNVVVQHVRVTGSRYVDVLGNATPYTATVGGGAVEVLRDGRRLTGTWRRPALGRGTRLLDAKGRDLRLKPGPTLVLLVPADRPLQVG